MARRRRYYANDYAFPEYVPVSEKRARNRRAAEQLRGEQGDVQPVTVEGRKIARTWWGESWNANLERYADYSNRIGRGRSYVRHGAVLDLRIGKGEVNALVQGSRRTPYQVKVGIDPLNDEVWETLRASALGQLDSLSDLLAGSFPKALRDTFFARGAGLFPTPKEISFDCSCPDWASMCKHVAAVLYGVGNRLDQEPELLFTLRRVSMEELVEKTIDATAQNLLDKADTAVGGDVLEDADIEDVFGIEFDGADAADGIAQSTAPVSLPPVTPAMQSTKKTKSKPKKQGRPGRRAAKTRKSSGPAAKTTARPSSKRTSARKSPPDRGTMVDQLVAVLPRGRKTFDTPYLRAKLTAWSETRVRNTLSRAISAGRIERVGHGVYRRSSG